MVQASYDDSPSGLKREMQDAMKAAKEGDQGKLGAQTAAMVLPNPAAWFSKVFGNEIGGIYAQHYAGRGIAAALASSFQDISA